MSQEVIAQLIRCKVPVVYRRRYENGVEVEGGWMLATCTKRDRFFRINGKIVSRNMAAWALRSGVAAFEPA